MEFEIDKKNQIEKLFHLRNIIASMFKNETKILSIYKVKIPGT